MQTVSLGVFLYSDPGETPQGARGMQPAGQKFFTICGLNDKKNTIEIQAAHHKVGWISGKPSFKKKTKNKEKTSLKKKRFTKQINCN